MAKSKRVQAERDAFVGKHLREELLAYEQKELAKKAKKEELAKQATKLEEGTEESESESEEVAEESDDGQLQATVDFLNALMNKEALKEAIKLIPKAEPLYSGSGKGAGESGGSDMISTQDFIRHAAEFARKDERTTKFGLEHTKMGDLNSCEEELVEEYSKKFGADLEGVLSLSWRHRVTVPEGSVDKLEVKADDDEVDEVYEFKQFSKKRGNMTLETLNVFFQRASLQDTVALKKELETKMTPLLEDQYTAEVKKPNLSLVKTSPEKAKVDGYYVLDNKQLDKTYAVVVAGESGSGKSVFACKKAGEEGFSVFYLCLKDHHFAGKDTKKPPNLKGDFLYLNHLVELAIKEATPDAKDKLYAFKRRLNASRDAWAKRVLSNAIKRNDDPTCLKDWIDEGWRKKNRPKKVAIVVDEATDIDLVEGLLSSVQEITAEYRYLAQDHVLLVIAGVGLDLINEESRIGTNPSHSRLVVVEGPDLDELKSVVSKEVAVALERGTFARTLKTNSRVLFRSVLPILEWDKHRVDANIFHAGELKARLEDRLTDVGSFGPMMDHGCRFYVNTNSPGTLARQRILLLLSQSFCYHLATAMEGVVAKTEHIKGILVRELEEVGAVDIYQDLKNPAVDDNIFTKGLSSRSGTSPALKYLACFGLTRSLRPAFGDEFEEMTALHYMRYKQVQGYRTRRVKLQHAWPPKNSNKAINADVLKKLGELLEEQKRSELVNEPAIEEVKAMLKGDSNPKGRSKRRKFNDEIGKDHLYCIVFDQGTPTAQGGDVLALLVNTMTNKAYLVCIQCKHYKTKEANDKILLWWNSLGVLLNEDGNSDFEPTEGSAGYSFKGLQKFAELLSDRLSEGKTQKTTVEVGTRILAASFRTPKSARCSFPMPKDNPNRFRLWFREMMEPTISAVQPKWTSEEYESL